MKLAVIRLADLYEDAMARTFDDATAVLHGLRDLIAHHPELRDYHEALNWIVEGDRFLNGVYGQVLYRRFGSSSEQPAAAVASIADAYQAAMDKRYEDAINDLHGLRDLIAHNPELREHHQAMTWLVDGHQVLIKMYQQVRAL